MKRLTAYVSGRVQRTGYSARITEIARARGMSGYVQNLRDGTARLWLKRKNRFWINLPEI
ncbi:MAG: hypothetical protein EHM14_02960 [Methanothrix sp.]|nr:MAG: hypothetical protein EHM14_02960 [Methanothrix sp.]